MPSTSIFVRIGSTSVEMSGTVSGNVTGSLRLNLTSAYVWNSGAVTFRATGQTTATARVAGQTATVSQSLNLLGASFLHSEYATFSGRG